MAGNIYAWSTTAANNASADSTINWAEGQLPGTVNDSGRAVMAVHAAELADNNATLTTGGTGAAYTVTSNLTPASLATGLRLRLKMNATNTGACTLNVTPNGGAAFGAKAIKVVGVGGEADPVAGVIQVNGHYNFNYDSGANSSAGAWVLLNSSVPDVSRMSGFRAGLSATASTSALTIALKTLSGNDPSTADPVYINFRSATGTTGTTSPLAVTAATSLVISAGSTLGVTSATAFRIWVVGFNDGGTFRLGAINCSTLASGIATVYPLLEGIASSTAEGGAGAADSAGVIYTGTAVSAKAMAVLGFLEWSFGGLTTAGTWTTTNLFLNQPYEPGATALPGRIVQVASTFSSNTAGTNVTTYTNSGFTQAITPQSSTNVIRSVACGVIVNSAGDGCMARLSRGTTANTNMFGNESAVNSTAAITSTFSLHGWDKPNTVGSTTYAAQFKSVLGGTATIGNNNFVSIEVQEIMG